MTWDPIPLRELEEMIEQDLVECSDQERSFFARAAMTPEKWRQSPYGDQGGGFWAVAVFGNRVLWFNDIEDGFNVSQFTTQGEIPKNEYWCNDDALKVAIRRLMEEVCS